MKDFVESSLNSIPVLLFIFHDSKWAGIYLLPVESMENPWTLILT